jgi:hypothetical protein
VSTLLDAPALAYWYRLDKPHAGIIVHETDMNWSVADATGTAVGSVRFVQTGMLQKATYWLSDAAGTPVVGYVEGDDVLLGPDGQPIGGLREPTVWWGQEAVGKYQVRLDRDPHRFGGAWMWDAADQVVATLGQTRTEGVGAYLQLDRPEPLTGPMATASLVLPFLAHLLMHRETQRDIHRRFRREDRGLRHFGGEQTDLL